HVADRHQADQPVLLDHRDVTEFAGGHALHDGTHGLTWRAGVDLARHHLRERFLEYGRAVFGERAHDVSLRQDADHAAVGTEHDERANPPFGQNFDRRFQRCGGLDGENVAALGGEDCLDSHGRLPPTGYNLSAACRPVLTTIRDAIEFGAIANTAGTRSSCTIMAPAGDQVQCDIYDKVNGT